eukprot:scaffold306444_cov33-Tisochrysis_lutea.AAC.1
MGSCLCASNERIHARCPSSVASQSPESRLQTLIVLSYEPVKTRPPWTAIARMPEWWPERVLTHLSSERGTEEEEEAESWASGEASAV